MKFTVLVLFGVAALAVSTPVENQKFGQSRKQPVKAVDKEFVTKQKDILKLFWHVDQPSSFKEHVDIVNSFELESYVAEFKNPAMMKHFVSMYKQGMLPRDHIFSVFNHHHLKQAIALFKVLHSAKTYDVFYKTAVWARQHVNQGQYLYALSAAVFHRHECVGVVLPPIYEIWPYYFFNTEVIAEAQKLKQIHSGTHQTSIGAGDYSYNGFTINSNYSGWYLNLHPEQSMSYFTEDLGINAFYYYRHLLHAEWLNYNDADVHVYSRNRGEEAYYVKQQLLARFFLERLSNNWDNIGVFDWQQPIETGFVPSLRYPNGLEFPSRPNWAKLWKNQNLWQHVHSFNNYSESLIPVEDTERRIRDAIAAGYIFTEDGQVVKLFDATGFNTLGNMIEGNHDSPNWNFYGALQIAARHILGFTAQPLEHYHLAPSVLEHFETSLRDPVYWQFLKRVIQHYQMYKTKQGKYYYDDIAVPGVKIEDIVVDRLVTYFENFDTEIQQSVYVNDEQYQSHDWNIRARQQRLNHKPFTYKINVVSDKALDAVVRVFIGPTYDAYGRHIDINENRMNFVEIDQFMYNLVAGKNVIERNSHDLYYSQDYFTNTQLWQHVNTGLQNMPVFFPDVHYTFPNRYLLPKGKPEGQSFQFFAIVSQYKTPVKNDKSNMVEQPTFHVNPIVGLGVEAVDGQPLGYPFDKPGDQAINCAPNVHFQEVFVYHKKIDEINNPARDI